LAQSGRERGGPWGEKRWAQSGLPFECPSPSPECWCRIKMFQPICEQAVKQVGGCICKRCSSLMLYHTNQLRTVWGWIGQEGRFERTAISPRQATSNNLSRLWSLYAVPRDRVGDGSCHRSRTQ